MPPRRSLLYLARDFPIPVSSAARLRTFNWVLHLSKHFDVTFVAAVRAAPEESHLEALEPYCSRLLAPALRRNRPGLRSMAGRLLAELRWLFGGMPPEAWWLQHGEPARVLEQLRRETRFDFVFAERWTWGPAALAMAPRHVLEASALQSKQVDGALRRSRSPLRRLLRRHVAGRHARLEARAAAGASLVLTQDPAARQRLRAACGDDRAVFLPSGLCTTYFAPSRSRIDPSNVLFFGSLVDPAQRDALMYLHWDVMPLVREKLRHAHVTVVGATTIPEIDLTRSGGSLVFTGPLEDDRPVLWRGAVAALPLRFGSGPRTHIAQLLAMGIPLIATPLAVAGLDLRSGDGIVIVHDGAEFASVLAQVLLDWSLREDLSRRGREVAQARLSIAATYDRLSTLLAQDVLPG